LEQLHYLLKLNLGAPVEAYTGATFTKATPRTDPISIASINMLA